MPESITSLRRRTPRLVKETLEYHNTEQSIPWTTTDYERLRSAVLAMIRTHRSVEVGRNVILSAFDGSSYWAVLAALDRANASSDD